MLGTLLPSLTVGEREGEGEGEGRGRVKKKATGGTGEGGGMKEDPSERKKISEKERTPLIFLLGGCFDGGEAKKTKKGEEKNTPYLGCGKAGEKAERLPVIYSIL